MTAQQQIAAAVMPVVERWLNTCPGQPLVLRADPCSESVEVNIGLGDKRRVTAMQAAEILGISAKTFSRHDCYGLSRGADKRFSRLAVERESKMEREFKIILWDGFHAGAVLTHWPQENTNAGTVWRFVMYREQTLIAVPYQTPDKPAPTNYCVPERIDPILAVGRFGFAVRYAAGVNINLENWEQQIDVATEKEFTAWKAKQDFPQTAEFEALRRQYHEKNQPDDLRDRMDVIQKSEAYKAEQVRLTKKRAELEAVHRKRVEKDKAAREKEIIAEAFEELRDALAAHGAKQRGTNWLKKLYNFIRDDVCRGNIMSPAIGAAGFQRIVEKAGELTGADITVSLLMECEPWRLAHESGAKGLERVQWLAVFEDGNRALIQNIQLCIPNGRDIDLYEKVKPSEDDRPNFEKEIEHDILKAKTEDWTTSEVYKKGNRFVLLDDCTVIIDLEDGSKRYKVTEDLIAHKALKAFADNTTRAKPLSAEKIKSFIKSGNNNSNSPAHWFRDGFRPQKEFKEKVYPALIQGDDGLWWIDLDGRKSP